MTTGLLVNSSLVTVDYVNRQRLPGANLLEAEAAAAGIVRLRARPLRPKTGMCGRCRG